ncbi:MAG: hypothetical protein MN733_38970 [Nitrososphaera sp.]|nr:hypothetical protein [Nitrososphaera sp.]
MNTLKYGDYTFIQSVDDPATYHASLRVPGGEIYAGLVRLYVDGDFSGALRAAKDLCESIRGEFVHPHAGSSTGGNK